MIRLVKVSRLKHIEGFSKKRVGWLRKKILKEGVWIRPLCIDRKHHLVLDGQHRMEVARELGLDVVPCLLFDYHDVEVWSLRKKHKVTVDLVIEKSLKGDVYPYKTVKHRFDKSLFRDCEYDLEELMPKKRKGRK